jgi:sulfide dehydrogenase cytochrome subunit
MISRRLIASLLLSVLGSLPTLAPGAEEGGLPEALVFNCFTCHGTDGKSTGAIPGLMGRAATFITAKLNEFKQGKGNPTVMDRIARGYTDQEIARIAEYIGALRN